jgi:hypothetical protein
MMKKLSLLWMLVALALTDVALAQQNFPEMDMTKMEVEGHMRFLASDALRGRRTGSAGNNIAAAYIAAQFEAFGLQQVPGAEGYYQPVMFESVTPPQNGSLSIKKDEFKLGESLVILNGEALDTKAKAVFANYGWIDAENNQDDYADLDVEGKIIFTLPGTPNDQSPQAVFAASQKKMQWAAERGAIAVIELFRLQFPWNFFLRYTGGESIRLKGENGDEDQPEIVYGFVKEPSPNPLKPMIEDGKTLKVKLQVGKTMIKDLPSQNVIGMIEGTDAELRDEYMILTAHYDHVGVGRQGGGAVSEQDSIFNGARDNGFGTTSLLTAAKALAQQPPRRSVIFLAVTGEELGLLGSRYYAANPLIPLNKTVFNFNTDTGGYNNTENVMVVGIEHVPVREQLEAGAAAFGLGILDDPMPEQNLFRRSDHYSFVEKGVPSIFMTPAMTQWDEEITKYYHQVADNPDTIDYDYLLNYCKVFTHTARLFGNMDERPYWKAGDEYEELGEKLYNK